MKLPQLNNSDKYIGLYVIDFGDHSATGYTAAEVAAILESEKYATVKVYKIAGAAPDGSLELQGITNDRFRLESGMFFHCLSADTAKADFEQLTNYGNENHPPCNVKLQLTSDSEGNSLIAMIYPAEYENEIGSWMLASGYKGKSAVDAGISQVDRFYNSNYSVIASKQLTPANTTPARPLEELLNTITCELQRAM